MLYPKRGEGNVKMELRGEKCEDKNKRLKNTTTDETWSVAKRGSPNPPPVLHFNDLSADRAFSL